MEDIRNASISSEPSSIGEPVGIAPSGSLLRPNTPKGTAFNRKTVTLIAVSCGAILMFGIMYAFTPQEGSLSKEALGDNIKSDQSSPGYSATTPEELNNLPNSYQDNQGQGNLPVPPDTNQFANSNYPTLPQLPMDYQQSLATLNNSQLTPEQKELLDAKRSPIRFNGVIPPNQTQKQTQPQTLQMDAVTAALLAANGAQSNQLPEKKGDQDQKNDFLNINHSSAFYSDSKLQAPLSKFEIKSGTIIPAVLITGVNSDLPGRLIAQVRENVFDTVTGRYLLIPQGTRIIGAYDSKINYGQERVLAKWIRLIYPNGYSIDLGGLEGVDSSGYSGIKDKTNNHYGKLIGGILLTSIFSAGAKVATSNDSSDQSYRAAAGQGVAENVANVGTKLAEKNMSIQPTLEIRPGFRFNVFVDKDFILKPYGK